MGRRSTDRPFAGHGDEARAQEGAIILDEIALDRDEQVRSDKQTAAVAQHAGARRVGQDRVIGKERAALQNVDTTAITHRAALIIGDRVETHAGVGVTQRQAATPTQDGIGRLVVDDQVAADQRRSRSIEKVNAAATTIRVAEIAAVVAADDVVDNQRRGTVTVDAAARIVDVGRTIAIRITPQTASTAIDDVQPFNGGRYFAGDVEHAPLAFRIQHGGPLDRVEGEPIGGGVAAADGDRLAEIDALRHTRPRLNAGIDAGCHADFITGR